MRSLADRQAALVAALVAGADAPPGFDPWRLDAARRALLSKRAGEAARAWPLLAAAYGDGWAPAFAAWARTRPNRGSLRDGWDFARAAVADGSLPAGMAVEELAVREAGWRYLGDRSPARRRWPAARRVPGAVVLQFLGRVRVLRVSRPAMVRRRPAR